MFALNVGYRSIAADLESLNGVVILPAENFSHRSAPTSEFQKVFLDPQLYLAGLELRSCAATCARLSSHPWFQVSDVPELSATMKTKEWQEIVRGVTQSNWRAALPPDPEKACVDAINFQMGARCSHIILPSPLIERREDEAAIQAEWLDIALEVASQIEPTQPLLATVALEESVINEESFQPTGFLDTVVDQVTSRAGISGVYIVISQTQREHPFQASRKVNKAYLHLTKKFSAAGIQTIIINFADVFGTVCVGAGATTIANGPSQSLRRLCLKGFEDSQFGRALPRFYSNRTVSEYLSQTDLSHVTRENLLRRIEDSTIFSNSLLKALGAGGSAATVPEWAESQNNVTASSKHFVQSQINFVSYLKGEKDRRSKVAEWLDDAEMYQSLLLQKIGSTFPDKRAPVGEWINIVREVLS